MAEPWRPDVSILGVGATAVTQAGDETAAAAAAAALRLALGDAGLRKEDVDGLAVSLGRPSGEDYDRLAVLLGLELRWVTQTWSHGRFMSTALQAAALAVAAGLADVVACLMGTSGIPLGPPSSSAERARPGGGPYGDLPHYGMTAPVAAAAMALRRYLHLYDADPSRLAEVALSARRYAALNERAQLRTPLTPEEYAASPPVVDPLREADCHLTSQGGTCVLVARTELARGLDCTPVRLVALQGLQGGREEHIFGRPGLGVGTQSRRDSCPSHWDVAIYERAGMPRDTIDGFYAYDAFAPQVWYALERFGFYSPGEAWRRTTQETMAPNGKLPVNTHGGMLAEGHLAGWGHVVEMVEQLRGRCGARQIADARRLQWGTNFGDAIILTNEEA